MGYLDPSVMKQVEEYSEVTQLFDALKRRFHQKFTCDEQLHEALELQDEAGIENSGSHSRLRRFVGRSSKYERGAF